MADQQYQTQTRTDGAGNSYEVRVPIGVADDYGNVISSASLAPKSPIQPVTPTPDNTNYSGMTSGITQSIIDSYKAYNTAQQSAQTNQQTTGQSILDYMKQLEGKTADTQAANDAAGVTAERENIRKYAQQLADLNAQASSLNRESQAIPLQTQENNRNTGATDAGIAPQNAGALRLNALKALSIGQQSDIAAAAATGSQLRLDAAKDKAQQIIDLKYKPIEDEIALKQKQYDLNKDTLDSIDKKRSEALQVALNKEAQDLADKKAKQKENADLSLQAGVKTKFMNKNGEISQVSDGTTFGTGDEFLKAAGVSSFEEAYQKGLITDVNGATLENIKFAQQAQAKYGDAGIKSTDTPEEVAQKIKGSAIYRKETYIAPPAGSGLQGLGLGGLVTGSIIDPQTDAQVRQIIVANPANGQAGGRNNVANGSQWDAAAQAIDAQFGSGTAQSYDSWLKSVYQGGQNINDLQGPSAKTGVDADVEAILTGRNTLQNIRLSMGRTNAAGAYIQQLRNKISGIDPKFDFVASDAGSKAVSSAYYQRSLAAINSVLPNIDKIVDLSNQVNRVGVSGVDKILQKGQLQIGNQKVSNFHEAQKLIADEIGLALGAGTVSDMKLQLGFDVTDPSVKPEVFASNMAIVREFVQNRKAGLQSLRYSSSTTNQGNNNDPLGLFK